MVICIFVWSCVTNVWVILIITPSIMMAVYLLHYCAGTIRDLKRLEAICKSMTIGVIMGIINDNRSQQEYQVDYQPLNELLSTTHESYQNAGLFVFSTCLSFTNF